MGIEEPQEDRLMARAVPGDDPTWGEVSAFMEAVDSAYAEIPTTQYEAAHMAAVASAARSIRNGLHTSRRKTMKDLFATSHRVLIASVVAGLLALTAGVGAASALGGGPLANFFPVAPSQIGTSPDVTAVPTATATQVDDESDDQGEDEGDDLTPEAKPTPTPKAKPTSTHEDDESEQATGRHRSHDSDESGDKAEKKHDDSDDEGEGSDDEGDDHDSTAGSHHGDDGDDSGDDGGHEDETDD